jgi:hypothetical protein
MSDIVRKAPAANREAGALKTHVQAHARNYLDGFAEPKPHFLSLVDVFGYISSNCNRR